MNLKEEWKTYKDNKKTVTINFVAVLNLTYML